MQALLCRAPCPSIISGGSPVLERSEQDVQPALQPLLKLQTLAQCTTHSTACSR